jgi:Protein of unknown function (DUF3443)
MCFNKTRAFLALLATVSAFLIAACGGGGAAVQDAGANVLAVVVDAGPAGTNGNVNRLYADVTICQPGTAQCQTIDHVLLDTGSTGLRLLSSVVAPSLNLTKIVGASGFPLVNCAKFVDLTFAWGPVVTADVLLGGKIASNVPIQVIADPVFNGLGSTCSSGTVINSISALGAKGILGVGLLKEDCGSGCTSNANNGLYFTCTNAGCSAVTGTSIALGKQLKNPVPLFASDNNGLVVDLPAVDASGASRLSGALYFGINTQSNNQFASGSVLTTSATGLVTTVFQGRTLGSSFIDTGSNGIYFDSSSIPFCSGAGRTGFYCPASTTPLTANLVGRNAVTVPIAFSIDNATSLFAGGSKSALPTLSGSINDARIFDWGLPFFYGRRVFIGVEGQSSALGMGPYYAF